ncbi:hypothetical protein [Kitasatospora phosalacinea]|uniref:Uncharacterized protein n=1 Tax=Kitasatospora phosalacinea TaxID=2065 RepID=A0A9W6PLJ1_9ACTN|nr:hypothetical protein [Kitasatospora phosalacinea]GLW57046.1 hypothetical protein Kpho01_50570 [Kitasatospora phosalacinea]
MDAELQKVVTGLEETREKLRSEVAAPLRAGRDRFPEADEHLLLGALAAMVESLEEIALVAVERRSTHFTAGPAHVAHGHLGSAAERLREAERQAGRQAERQAGR